MTEQSDLLAAVDAITKPRTLLRLQHDTHDHEWEPLLRPMTADERVQAKKQHQPIRPVPTGDLHCQWCTATTTTPKHANPSEVLRRRDEIPLLDQLAAAIASSIESGGSGKAARERVPIDVAALTLYETIDGRIRSWLDELGARPGKNITPTQSLRTWYTLWSAGQHDEHLEHKYQTVITSWEQQILDKLQPPTRIELTAPCTVCGKEWINIGLKLPNGQDDPNDTEMVRVLNAVERATLEDSYAICAACNTVWQGPSRMRQLRIDMDDQAAG